MKPPRFYMTDDYGLIFETPVPITPRQREAVRLYAIKEYKRRLIGLPTGDRRDAIRRVLTALVNNRFAERAIPLSDSEREVVLHG
jgi:hypothetical protein